MAPFKNVVKEDFSNQKKLLTHLKKGDTDAYTYLIEMYYKDLCNYAKNLARDDFKSEDIVQNVIIKIWQQREKLNPKVSIGNYLYRSVYNEFIDQYRKDLAITSLEKKYIEHLELFVETRDEEKTRHIISLVEKEIDKLPQKCKETFLLSKKSGLTYVEIAAYQNVSVNTVEKQIVKAFSILRKRLDGKWSLILFMLFGMDKTNQFLDKMSIFSGNRLSYD